MPRVLLLQGPRSRFPGYLARALAARGAEVHRICFCPGDWLFGSGGARTTDYREPPDRWAEWIAARASAWDITDLVCLGDGRFWHRVAIDRLRPMGIRVHVIEQGYLRPHFLTIERDGTGGNSRFPADWERLEDLAAGCHETKLPDFRTSFTEFALMDVLYEAANLIFGWRTHPHYRTHTLDGALTEWAGWIAKAALWPIRRRARADAMARIAHHRGPLFLLPLQLETDYQIRLHGPYGGMAEALSKTLASFAAHAAEDAAIVIKPHPLDNGLAGWQRRVMRKARRLGIEGRVIFVDGGNLDLLIPGLTGVVTVNSTVGLTALREGRPVKVLGRAIYDLPGLTHPGSLASFWNAPAVPEPERVAVFVRALMAANQVPGGFDGSGARSGSEGVAERIITHNSPQSHAPSNRQGDNPREAA
ncbi:MAG: capsular biosynthesis protein [Pseudomonadota bacterium]